MLFDKLKQKFRNIKKPISAAQLRMARAKFDKEGLSGMINEIDTLLYLISRSRYCSLVKAREFTKSFSGENEDTLREVAKHYRSLGYSVKTEYVDWLNKCYITLKW